MGSVRIGYAKPEIRVLGLSVARLRGSAVVVGAVTRGAGRLEGVLRGDAPGPDLTAAASAMIDGSPHRGQIRAVLIDAAATPPGLGIDAEALWSSTGKPVILLRPPGSPSGVWKGTPFSSHGLSPPGARRVLGASALGAFPEAVRVASLISWSLGEAEGKV